MTCRGKGGGCEECGRAEVMPLQVVSRGKREQRENVSRRNCKESGFSRCREETIGTLFICAKDWAAKSKRALRLCSAIDLECTWTTTPTGNIIHSESDYSSSPTPYRRLIAQSPKCSYRKSVYICITKVLYLYRSLLHRALYMLKRRSLALPLSMALTGFGSWC